MNGAETMVERPIQFQASMVRSVLQGSKTQTRRLVKRWEPRVVKKPSSIPVDVDYLPDFTCYRSTCPYGQPGDRLWVRETFAKVDGQTRPWIETDYRATYTHGDRLGDWLGIKKRWTPSIHMPRAASRITLEVTGVGVERLQDISEDDAKAEGVLPADPCDHARRSCEEIGCGGPVDYRGGYRLLWEQIYGPGSWEANPWVWVVSFRVVELYGQCV